MNRPRLTRSSGAEGCGLGAGPVLRLEWPGATAGALRLDAGSATWGPVGAGPAAADPAAAGPAAGGPLRPGDELWYAVRPRFDETAADVRDGFRAGSLALDLVTVDGRRLLDVPGQVDVDRLPADPAGTADRDVLVPDEWNLRRVPLDRLADAVPARFEVVVETPAPRGPVAAVLSAEVQLLGVRPAPAMADRLLETVDTRRGSASSMQRSRGNTVPLVAVPHGFTLVTPVTDARDRRWTYTWQSPQGRPRLVGLAVSHSPSPWIGDRGALLVQAGDGRVEPAGHAFGHDAEHAHPHRYDVLLDDGRRVRATASDHVMVVSFELPGARRPVLRIGGLGAFRVELVAADDPEPDGARRDLVGWVEDGEPGSPGARLYLRLRLDRPVLAVRADAGAVLLELAPGEPAVEVRVGTSHLSTDEAGAALDREAPDGFDDVAARTEQRWATLLSRVQVRGASPDEQRTLAANLVRMFTYPSSLTERSALDGRPVHASPHLADRPADGPRRSRWRALDGPMFTNHGLWDTYRTVWPAAHLLAPDLVPGLVDGFVQHAREGGWTPRWAAPGYLDAMVGTSLDVVLADAAACGVDLGADAYLAALRDATCVPPEPQVGRAGQLHAMLRGWVPADVPESVSWTLEGALADFGVAVLARRRAAGLGQGAARAQLEVEARYLRSRAAAYRHLYVDGFFRARGRDGAFVEPFDPAAWGGGYTETNAWGTAFSVPHDGAGLVRLHGSRPALVAHLWRFFGTPETGRAAVRGTYPQVIHEMVEARDVRLGMWAPSNQPAHHIPFMASVAGAPELGHEVVHEALARLFTGGLVGQGYPGDEDNGELSAWWFLAVLGLYPLAPGSGEWLIGPPAFDELVVAPPGRPPLRVVAHRADRRDRYVHRVEVDGRPWSSTVLPHDRVRAGVRLDVWLGSEPNGWGTDPADAPSSLSDDGDPLLVDVAVEAALDGVAVPELVDDAGARTVRWRAGQQLEVHVAPGTEPVLGTLLVASPTALAWRVEASPDGRTWTPVVARAELAWWWPDQLRPFDLPVPAGTVRVRMTLLDGVADVRQVEVLAPVP